MKVVAVDISEGWRFQLGEVTAQKLTYFAERLKKQGCSLLQSKVTVADVPNHCLLNEN